MHDIRTFTHYFRPYKKSLAAGSLFIFASVIIGLLVPLIVGRAVDELRQTGVTWMNLTYYGLTLLGVSAMSGVFLFLQRRVLIGMSRHIEYDLRQDFYTHLQRQPLSFFQTNRIGDLMARATNDLAAVRQLAGPMIMYTLQTVFVVV
ncbi:MAG: ABC transporter ATP-binding protein, partial [Pyrinomonadaceae bacterium]|nr:ABC transporter ATP-binding protein [Pyrinomonadaceae bacterium]